MVSLPPVRPTSPDHLAGMRHLAGLIEGSSASTEAAGTLTAEVVDALLDADLFRMLAPACLGGGELSCRDGFEVVEEASRADGSTGWCLMAGAVYLAAAGAFLPEEGAAAVFVDGRAVPAGQAAPLGVATPTSDGWVVRGDFAFASGAAHSSWFYGGFREVRDGAVVVLDSGLPSAVVAVIPRDRVELQGNWDVIGLGGTGSFDYRVPEQEIPRAFTFPLFDARPLRGHSRFRMGLAGLTCIGHSAFACGVARRALDEAFALSQTKRRPGRSNLIDDPIFQSAFAQAEARLTSARTYALHAIEALEDAAVEDRIGIRDRAVARLATTNAATVAVDVATTMFRFSGSVGLRNGSIIQRCFRDLSAGEQHVFTDHNTYRDAGRLLLGVGPETLLT